MRGDDTHHAPRIAMLLPGSGFLASASSLGHCIMGLALLLGAFGVSRLLWCTFLLQRSIVGSSARIGPGCFTNQPVSFGLASPGLAVGKTLRVHPRGNLIAMIGVRLQWHGGRITRIMRCGRALRLLRLRHQFLCRMQRAVAVALLVVVHGR